jgi:hypothetical protein
MVTLVAVGMLVSGCQSSPGTGAVASGAASAPPTGAGSAGAQPTGAGSGIFNTSNLVASPATSLGPHNPLSGPPADPFAGTPAEGWANGAAGIVLPAAHPVGRFGAGQVAAAYAMTRTLLIAQNLDKQTLRGGSPTAFASLLTAQQRKDFLTGLNKTARRKDGSPASTRSWVASFAPGTTSLVGNVIKVHGTMSARAATDQGRTVLDIDINYRFVYVVEPPGKPDDWMRIVGQLSGYVEFLDWEDPGGPLQPWVLYDPAEAGGKCGMADGYTHPDYPSDRAAPGQSGVQPSGTPIDPYSMAIPTLVGYCQATTGT